MQIAIKGTYFADTDVALDMSGCPCNKCKEQNPRPRQIEKGFVKHGWVLGDCCSFRTSKGKISYTSGFVKG